MMRQMTISIYQLPVNENNKEKLFRNFVQPENGQEYTVDDYEKVYEYDITVTNPDINQILENVFRTFNIDHPADFKGRSLSVSDVVAIKYNEFIAAYYVDMIGFKRLDKFFKIPKPLDIENLPTLPYYLMIFDSKSDLVIEDFEDASDREFTSQICETCIQKHKSYLKDKIKKENYDNYSVKDLLCGVELCVNHATHVISLPKDSCYVMLCPDESD